MIDERPGSTLAAWAEEGVHYEAPPGTIVSYTSPDGQYTLSVEFDGEHTGHLLRLHRHGSGQLARVLIADSDLLEDVAHEVAEHADDYDSGGALRHRLYSESDSEETRGYEATVDGVPVATIAFPHPKRSTPLEMAAITAMCFRVGVELDKLYPDDYEELIEETDSVIQMADPRFASNVE